MGYPERLLSDDEVIESQFRPHWSGILGEGLMVLAGVAVRASHLPGGSHRQTGDGDPARGDSERGVQPVVLRADLWHG